MDKKIDMAVNLNPLGMPKRLSKKLKSSIGFLNSYSDQYNESIIKELSKSIGVKKENIIFGNGSTEIFFMLPHVFKIEKCLVVGPTFWEYEYTNKINNAKVDYFMTHEEENFKINFKKLEKVITGYPFVYFCNTNNPTSVSYGKKDLLRLIEKNKKTFFIIDETYLLFHNEYDKRTLNKEVVKNKNLMVITSLSKFFSVPGLRIGFGCSNKGAIERLVKFQIPFTTCSLTQFSIKYLLNDKEYMKKTREFIQQQKNKLYELYLGLHIIKPFKPEANFILCKIKDESLNAKKLTRIIEDRGFLIRDCTPFRGLGDKYVRFTLGNRKDGLNLYRQFKEIDKNGTKR
jgi:threonine-phosphate decarboxylase